MYRLQIEFRNLVQRVYINIPYYAEFFIHFANVEANFVAHCYNTLELFNVFSMLYHMVFLLDDSSFYVAHV